MSDYTVPVKMNIKHLMIEMTRECNLKCEHCMRGDAQNITITPEIIDKTLDNIETIFSLTLTGGEPFLHPDMIEYLFDGIIRRGIVVGAVSTVTNGTVCDMRSALAFNKIVDYISKNSDPLLKGNIGRISISTDKYHKESPFYFSEATAQFYKKHCSPKILVDVEDLNFRDSRINEGNSPVLIDALIKEGYSDSLWYSGRAKNLPKKIIWSIDCSCHRFAMGSESPDAICKDFKNKGLLSNFRTEPLFVYCGVEITAKGGFHMFSSISFDEHDKLAQDNILTCSLYDCIWNWNHRYPLSCAEAERLYRIPTENILNNGDPLLIKSPDCDLYSIEDSKKDLLALDDVIWVRQQLQNRYKDKFLPFVLLVLATEDTAKDSLELSAHDLNSRWDLLRKASKKLKELLIVHHIDTSCPDLKYDDTDYDNTTDDDGLGFMAMMELLEKY